jgi:hypothetical protein
VQHKKNTGHSKLLNARPFFGVINNATSLRVLPVPVLPVLLQERRGLPVLLQERRGQALPVLASLLLLPASALLPFYNQLPQTIMSRRKAGKEKWKMFFSWMFHLLSKIF